MADDMLVGTPLFEEEAGSGMVPTKHVDPIWKQEVVDAEGRRRFHGAFTGGFSAGYYNTVGSAEGWAPAEFKSSRSSRNDAKAQTAEDFMDEDDLTSFGGKQLQTNSQYDSLGSTADDVKRQAQRASEAGGSVIPGAVPEELVAPADEGIGKQLLRLMGWREGQGLGPRKARKRKRKGPAWKLDAPKPEAEPEPPAKKKRYGCPLPPGRAGAASDSKPAAAAAKEEEGDDDDEEEEEDPYGAAFLFAPKNTAVFDPGTGKNNSFGLGFDPYTNAEEFRQGTDERGPDGRRLPQQRGAFGIGALEADDDHEVYDHSDRSQYDFEIGGPEGAKPRERRDSGPPARHGAAKGGGGGLAEVDEDGGRCSDGMPALKGFRVADRSNVKDKWYAPPKVPRDFNPFHKFAPEEGEVGAASVTSGNWVVDENGGWKLEPPKPKPAPAGGGGGRPHKNMSAAERGAALGEPQQPVSRPPPGVGVAAAPAPPLGQGASLMSLSKPGLSDSDRQRIAATLAAGSRFVKASTATDAPTEDGQALPPELATAFADDLPKRQRLEAYHREKTKSGLRSMGGTDGHESMGPWAGAGMTEWEVSREKEEFTALLAGKSAAQSGAQGGLRTGKEVVAAAAAAQAVRRSTIAWQPMKLLCKRFNVPDPYGGGKGNSAPEGRAATQELLTLPDEVYALAQKGGGDKADAGDGTEGKGGEEKGDGGASAAAEEAVEKPVPGGIFKAIFDESSSEEDEDEDDDEEEEEEEEKEAGERGGDDRGGNAMARVEEDPLQSLFRESGRYGPVGSDSSRDERRGGGDRRGERRAEEPVVVPLGGLGRGQHTQGGWLSRQPAQAPPPSRGGGGGGRWDDRGRRGGEPGRGMAPMGRGKQSTQPAWMAQQQRERERGQRSPPPPEPRSFAVPRPQSGSGSGEAQEAALRQAMVEQQQRRQAEEGGKHKHKHKKEKQKKEKQKKEKHKKEKKKKEKHKKERR